MSLVSFLRNLLVAGAVLSLAGCADDLVKISPGSEKIVVARPDNVTFCKQVGSAQVSVLATVGLFSRSTEAIDADLKQLGRNAAVSQGGDTIVAEPTTVIGQRTWLIYQCRHP